MKKIMVEVSDEMDQKLEKMSYDYAMSKDELILSAIINHISKNYIEG